VLRDIDRVIITRDQIARRIDELGAEISRDVAGLGADEEIVVVPILLGAVIFVADLMRRLPHKMRMSVVTVRSYPGRATRSKGAELISALPEDLHDKHVLIVDDILDSGRTIRLICDAVRERQARSVEVCVLLRKTIPAALATPCRYVGFDIPDEFVVGYGLDYDNYYRNLPDVGVLKKEVMQE
jgi:hypoxanthine phosphoribosyltransferase